MSRTLRKHVPLDFRSYNRYPDDAKGDSLKWSKRFIRRDGVPQPYSCNGSCAYCVSNKTHKHKRRPQMIDE